MDKPNKLLSWIWTAMCYLHIYRSPSALHTLFRCSAVFLHGRGRPRFACAQRRLHVGSRHLALSRRAPVASLLDGQLGSRARLGSAGQSLTRRTTVVPRLLPPKRLNLKPACPAPFAQLISPSCTARQKGHPAAQLLAGIKQITQVM